ncbi:hypothetical protein [Klebsiella pneumoniae]|uniref:hypothetical protein n=1 Tax=Klebsiella pneumoniae TaxID=573 RepID=UPI003977D669
MTTRSHHDNVEKQFGSQASAYLTSAVHASGRDLQRLAERLADFPQAKVLDMGCGPLVEAIRLYQQSASAEVKAYFELQEDGSFTSDTILFEAHKAV